MTHPEGVSRLAKLAAMRDLYCDCEIIIIPASPSSPCPTVAMPLSAIAEPTLTCVHSDKSDDAASLPTERILAHRAVLCQATFFARLFECNDPDYVDLGQIGGERALRAVYVAEIPFPTGVVAFLIDRFYGHHQCRQGVEPIQAIRAALFLGLSEACITNLILETLRAMADDGVVLRPDRSDAACKMAATNVHSKVKDFVASVMQTNVSHKTKVALTRRFFDCEAAPPLLPHRTVPCTQDKVSTAHQAAACAYAAPTPSDHRLASLFLNALDGATMREIVCGDLVLLMALDFSHNTNGTDDVVLRFECAPAGEALGAWPFDREEPEGVVDVPPRAVVIRADLRHPTRGAFATVLTSWASAAVHVPLYRRQHRSYAEATGARLAGGAVLLPNTLERVSQGHGETARRVARASLLADDGDPRDRLLWSCRVDIHDWHLPLAFGNNSVPLRCTDPL
jgi:hypothetical protein